MGYIKDLIDNAQSGSTVYIPTGTYYETSVYIGEKTLTIIGAGKDITTIVFDSVSAGSAFYLDRSFVTFRDMTLRDTYREEMYPVLIATAGSGAKVYVENVKFIDAPVAIGLYGSDGGDWIKNCDFINHWDDGIVSRVGNVVVDSCTFDFCGTSIELNVDFRDVHNWHITNCVFTNDRSESLWMIHPDSAPGTYSEIYLDGCSLNQLDGTDSTTVTNSQLYGAVFAKGGITLIQDSSLENIVLLDAGSATINLLCCFGQYEPRGTVNILTCGTQQTICYECNGGYYPNVWIIHEITCPSGWYKDSIEECSQPPITCYQCQGDIEVSQTFTGTTCPAGWFPTHQTCGSGCIENSNKCIGADWYECHNEIWWLVEKNSPACPQPPPPSILLYVAITGVGLVGAYFLLKG